MGRGASSDQETEHVDERFRSNSTRIFSRYRNSRASAIREQCQHRREVCKRPAVSFYEEARPSHSSPLQTRKFLDSDLMNTVRSTKEAPRDAICSVIDLARRLDELEIDVFAPFLAEGPTRRNLKHTRTAQ